MLPYRRERKRVGFRKKVSRADKVAICLTIDVLAIDCTEGDWPSDWKASRINEPQITITLAPMRVFKSLPD